jgi:hypothetical protein
MTGLTLALALGSIGLGYGIRYGYFVCLYAAISLFTILTGSVFYIAVSWHLPRFALRGMLSGYMLWLLCRALAPMAQLSAQQAFPLPMSRYGAFFLSRRALTAAGKRHSNDTCTG